jgi:hypothetical protein
VYNRGAMRLRRLIPRPLPLLAGLPALAIVIAVLFGVSPLPGGETVPSVHAAVTRKGDVNCSKFVDAVDGLQMLRSAAGLSFSADCMADAGDVDCSLGIGIPDVLAVLRFVGHLDAKLGAACLPIAPNPNSYLLIDDARAAGDINSETALLYKLYVTFTDPRLPPAYHGDDSETWDDPMAVAQAVATYDSLSPATQAAVAPFLLPPDAPGSWQQLRGSAAGEVHARAVTYSRVEKPHVILYYRDDRPQDQALAESLGAEVESKIWNELTGLMGAPKPDTGRPNNFDDRIDIWLSGDNTRAYAASIPPCNETSGYIVLGEPYADKYTLTHELMHVIDYHFLTSGCWYDEYRWIHEATSEWSMDFVYPGANKERNSNIPSCMLDYPRLPLEYRNDCHEYAAYILMFYLHRHYGKQYIRDIWDSFAGNDSLEGIDAALAPLGGLKKIWPKFAAENYNGDPPTKYQDDGLTDAAYLEDQQDVSLGGAPSRTYNLRGDADHLTAFYYEYSFQDQAIKQVTFKHHLKDQPTAAVTALILYEGATDWVEEDWTPSEEKRLCYDDPGQQKFEKLVIVISNSEFQNRSAVLNSSPQPELEVKNSCKITGAASGTYSWTEGYREDWKATADIAWVEHPDYLFGCNCRVFFPEGDIQWTWEFHYDDQDPPCNDHESGVIPAGTGLDTPIKQSLILWEDPNNPDQYLYSAIGYVPASWFSDCENGDRTGLTFIDIPVPDTILTSTPTFPPTQAAARVPAAGTCDGPFAIAKDAKRITGSCVYDGNLSYQWDFKLP